MALLVHPGERGSRQSFRVVSAAERFSPPYLKNKAGKVFAPFLISGRLHAGIRGSLSARCMQHHNQKRGSDIQYSQQHGPHRLRAQRVHRFAQQAQQS